jgi:hypothetical protein
LFQGRVGYAVMKYEIKERPQELFGHVQFESSSSCPAIQHTRACGVASRKTSECLVLSS